MKKIIVFLLIFLFPINVFSLSIKSKHAILYNLNDDEILYNLDQDTRISIASMIKIMTCIIAIESVDELEKMNGLDAKSIALSIQILETLREL